MLRGGAPYRTYFLALGLDPQGQTQRQGDGRTAEGHYTLDHGLPDSRCYEAKHVAYPNAEDRRQAAARGDDPGA